MTASGTFGYGVEMADYVDLNVLGALVVKTITREPRAGNPMPRVIETPSGLLNAIGLQNDGLDDFLNEKLPFLRQFDTKIVANVAGESVEDYAHMTAAMDRADGVDAIEMNLSCPNVARGLDFSRTPDAVREMVTQCRSMTSKTLIAKLSPNVTDIVPIAKACEDAGADGVTLINTLLGMAIDIETQRPILANVVGGLSGPAIRPVAVRIVYQVAQAISIPIIGVGGIMDGRDAIEFMLAGATAVQVGTASFVDPRATMAVLDGIERYCSEKGIGEVSSLIGAVHAS
jgi:dihydroorotate dehydrogenase (NAD+) catalytic subunit